MQLKILYMESLTFLRRKAISVIDTLTFILKNLWYERRKTLLLYLFPSSFVW